MRHVGACQIGNPYEIDRAMGYRQALEYDASSSSVASRLRKNRVKRTRALPQTCCEGPRRPVGFAPVAARRRNADGPAPFPRSSWGFGQVADADQVVRCQAEDEHPAHSTSAAVEGLAQEPDGLEPAEDLFDTLAGPLAHLVAGVTRGARIDRTRTV